MQKEAVILQHLKKHIDKHMSRHQCGETEEKPANYSKEEVDFFTTHEPALLIENIFPVMVILPNSLLKEVMSWPGLQAAVFGTI